jgi:hypothetical protein
MLGRERGGRAIGRALRESVTGELLMMLSIVVQEARPRFRSDRRSNPDCSRRAAFRFLADSSLRSRDCTSHSKIAGGASSRSPI